VSDAFARSGGRIDFPAHFAEGYAYLQLKIYGDRPGNFLGDTNAWLWMPKGLLTCDNAEVNYIAARSGNTLYLALMNQSANAITAGCQLDAGLVGLNPDSAARVWNGKEDWASTSFGGGKFSVNVAANGMSVLAISNVVITPEFQNKLRGASPAWRADRAALKDVKAQAHLLNFGGDRRWAYIFLQERDEFKSVTLCYNTGGDWQTETDVKFPFEFSVAVPADAKEFAFKIKAERASGASF
jgi:hypothetical protein